MTSLHPFHFAPVGALLASVLAGCGPAPHVGAEPAPPIVDAPTETVQSGQVDTLHEASGTVRGRNTAILAPKVPGTLRVLRVRAGDHVSAGQILAVLESADLQAGLRRARAGLDEAEAARTGAESAARAAESAERIATSTYERLRKLAAERAVTAQQLDEAEARYRGAQAGKAMADSAVRGAQTRIEQARAEIGGAEAQLAFARIAAPFAGRVIERRAELGSFLPPGAPIYVIEQDGALRVEAAIDESLSGRVRVGDTASITLGDRPVVEGRISEVVPAIEVGSRAFLVKIDLPALADLRPGMFARVALRAGKSGRLEVPAAAVSRHGQLDRVYVVEGGRARLRLVTLGEPRGDRIEVLSGVDPGEQVVAALRPGLVDGARIGSAR
jgi:multidrug efflux pump subunit AcrA (membrane-fusion protein)